MKNIFLAKKNSLVSSYYFNFFCLIVIPILLIIFVVFFIIQNMMLNTATGKIRLAQENVMSTLNSEVKDTMIRLSHLVHTNNYEVIEMAEAASSPIEKERYRNMQVLNESFQYMVAPADDIISVCFYMKDGSYTYLKDDVNISRTDIKSSHWYQNALMTKGQVQTGSYAGRTTFGNTRKNQYTIVAAISPTDIMDKKQGIEMITLWVSSEAGYMMNDYNKDASFGTMYLTDSAGKTLLNVSGNDCVLPSLSCFNDKGIFQNRTDGKKVMYQLSEVQQTGWKLISVVNHNVLVKDFQKIALWILLVTSGLFCLFAYFSFTFLKNIYTPLNHIAVGFRQVQEGDLDTQLTPTGQTELRNMTFNFNAMVRKLKILIELNKQQEQKKHEAEIRALQSQINPHFLVNTLNSIRFMAQVAKFEGIKNMAEALINILSCSFRSNISFYSVEEELNTLKSYVFLMGIRYSNGFEVIYDVSEPCFEYQIPRLILQPLVENSIVHGFSEMEDIGIINVAVSEKEDSIYFEVRDNGKGMSKEEIEHVLRSKESSSESISIGISNVNDRLKLNYGETYALQMESELNNYTKIFFHTPKIKKQENTSHVPSNDC